MSDKNLAPEEAEVSDLFITHTPTPLTFVVGEETRNAVLWLPDDLYARLTSETLEEMKADCAKQLAEVEAPDQSELVGEVPFEVSIEVISGPRLSDLFDMETPMLEDEEGNALTMGDLINMISGAKQAPVMLTTEQVIAAYKAGDLSNPRALLAITALAWWDTNIDVMMMAMEQNFETALGAMGLVNAYRNGERVCSNCDGEEGCPVQLAFDTLVEYQRQKDEEAAWAEHDQTEPAMAEAVEESAD